MDAYTPVRLYVCAQMTSEAMKHAINVMNQKGGSGKTTLAVHVAAALAREGRRVLLIDNDPQANATTWLGEPSADATNRLYKDTDAPLGDCIIEARPGLHLVRASFDLTEGRDLATADQMNGPYRLADRAATMNDTYDAVVIDNNPGSDTLTLNSLTLLAELGAMGWNVGVAVPVRTSALDVGGLVQLEQSITNLARRLDNAPQIRAIVPSVADGRKSLTQDAIEQLMNEYNGLVTRPARISVRLEEAPAAGQTIFEYDASGRGAEDYRAITTEIINRL